MKLCNDDCYPICDFCKYFEATFDVSGSHKRDAYICGFCELHLLPTDITDECEYFYCLKCDPD